MIYLASILNLIWLLILIIAYLSGDLNFEGPIFFTTLLTILFTVKAIWQNQLLIRPERRGFYIRLLPGIYYLTDLLFLSLFLLISGFVSIEDLTRSPDYDYLEKTLIIGLLIFPGFYLLWKLIGFSFENFQAVRKNLINERLWWFPTERRLFGWAFNVCLTALVILLTIQPVNSIFGLLLLWTLFFYGRWLGLKLLLDSPSEPLERSPQSQLLKWLALGLNLVVGTGYLYFWIVSSFVFGGGGELGSAGILVADRLVPLIFIGSTVLINLKLLWFKPPNC